LTRLDAARGEHAHLYPQVLPGGRGILFTQRLGRDFADVENSNIAVLETATGKRRTVLEGASFARYGGGRLVFLRGSSLFSAPFDLASLAVSGPPVPLAEPVAVEPGEGIAQFALSEDGTLAFIDGGPIAIRRRPSCGSIGRARKPLSRFPKGITSSRACRRTVGAWRSSDSARCGARCSSTAATVRSSRP
jgi:hypothetical protein